MSDPSVQIFEVESPQYRPFMMSLSASGVTGVQQETEIDTVADVSSSLNDTYFLYDTPSQGYYVWINVDAAGTDPAVAGRIGIEVAINEDDTADDVATAIAAAMNAVSGIAAAAVADVVTAINDADGVADDADDGPGGAATGFTISTSVPGVDSGVGLTYGQFDASIAEAGAGEGDYIITFNKPFVQVPQVVVMCEESCAPRIKAVDQFSVQIETNNLSGAPTDTAFHAFVIGSFAEDLIIG
jgi:hypothetical protein